MLLIQLGKLPSRNHSSSDEDLTQVEKTLNPRPNLMQHPYTGNTMARMSN
jgi:hypothetical protein